MTLAEKGCSSKGFFSSFLFFFLFARGGTRWETTLSSFRDLVQNCGETKFWPCRWTLHLMFVGPARRMSKPVVKCNCLIVIAITSIYMTHLHPRQHSILVKRNCPATVHAQLFHPSELHMQTKRISTKKRDGLECEPHHNHISSWNAKAPPTEASARECHGFSIE